jgi:LysR family transcriptional regulator for metE and metH
MPILESRHLRLIAEIARRESATRAAEELHVTQSAVSHHLCELEHKLGTRLFVRSGRRMLLTPAGRHLAETAERVLAEIERAEATVSQLVRNEIGELRVCTECHTGYHWLPPLLEAMRARYPAFEIRIAAEHTMNPVAALLDAKLDLAIINSDPDDKRLRLDPLFEDEHVAVVHPSHVWAARSFITPQELAAEHLLLYSRSLDKNFTVAHVMRPAGLEPSHATYVQLTEAILEMVKARIGVTVLPAWSIAPAIASGSVRAVRITAVGVRRQWTAARLAAATPSRFLDDFIRHLIEHGRSVSKTSFRPPATAGVTPPSTSRSRSRRSRATPRRS